MGETILKSFYLPFDPVVSVFRIWRKVTDFHIVEVLFEVLEAHPELSVLLEGQPHLLFLVVRNAGPLV